MENRHSDLQPLIAIIQELNLKIDSIKPPRKFYRNKDLKNLFGISDNTIINYRDNNIIPFTKLGEVYCYPIEDIDLLLQRNSNFSLFKDRRQ